MASLEAIVLTILTIFTDNWNLVLKRVAVLTSS